MIGGYVSYYSTTQQSNPTVTCNLSYYISGAPSQVVDGCSWLGTLPTVAANIVTKITCPMVPLVNANTNSFCVTFFNNLSRTFYVYQWGIHAVRIA